MQTCKSRDIILISRYLEIKIWKSRSRSWNNGKCLYYWSQAITILVLFSILTIIILIFVSISLIKYLVLDLDDYYLDLCLDLVNKISCSCSQKVLFINFENIRGRKANLHIILVSLWKINVSAAQLHVIYHIVSASAFFLKWSLIKVCPSVRLPWQWPKSSQVSPRRPQASQSAVCN